MSIWPRRRPAVPAYARAWLGAEERVLAFAATPAGVLVVATPRGLWIGEHAPAAAGHGTADPGGRLCLWELIVTAKWAADVLTVTTAHEVAPRIMKRLPAIRLALPQPADLPRVVRQRIDRSVVVSHRRALGTGSTVLLVARRVSGGDGLLWYSVFDTDGDAEIPQARAQATAMLDSLAAVRAPAQDLD